MSGRGDKRLPTSANAIRFGISDSASSDFAAPNSSGFNGDNQPSHEQNPSFNAESDRGMLEQAPLPNDQIGGPLSLDKRPPAPVLSGTQAFFRQVLSVGLDNDATHRSDSASHAISYGPPPYIQGEHAQHIESPPQAKPELLPIQDYQVFSSGGGTNTWKCDACPAATYAKKSELTSHRKNHHSSDTLYKYACTVPGCGLKFERRDKLNAHSTWHERGTIRKIEVVEDATSWVLP
ncbi:hypothetical protein EMPG_13036 [Blastomyces silverae]|uniref:C2H2-type domain-containing protein n=1 Tax=Blastomyces silverae TaxID=2060906 RepID=A0A0H1BL37_9EURO|nr:hypothetical protein EMPG_13036 [Blastomyces silverae]